MLGVKACCLREAEQAPSSPSFIPTSPETSRLPYTISNQTPPTECPSLLLPVHLSICSPGSLLLHVIFFLNNHFLIIIFLNNHLTIQLLSTDCLLCLLTYR